MNKIMKRLSMLFVVLALSVILAPLSVRAAEADVSLDSRYITVNNVAEDCVLKVTDGGTTQYMVLHSGTNKIDRNGVSDAATFTTEPINWPAVEVKFNGTLAAQKEVGFTISVKSDYTGDAEIKIKDDYRSEDCEMQTGGTSLKPRDAGEFSIKGKLYTFYADMSDTLYHDFTYKFTVNPPAPRVPTKCTGNHKQLTFDGDWDSSKGDGAYFILQIYKNGKWEYVCDKNNIKNKSLALTANELKDNTKYNFRVQSYIPKNEKHGDLWSPFSKTFSVTTASAQKPVIKSVKCKMSKPVYHKKKWVATHWDTAFGKWIKGHYEPAYYTTRVKVTVTLKKKIPGAKGMFVFLNAKGAKFEPKFNKNGTSYSYYITLRSSEKKKNYWKGKKISAQVQSFVADNEDWKIYGLKSSKKSGKIK